MIFGLIKRLLFNSKQITIFAPVAHHELPQSKSHQPNTINLTSEHKQSNFDQLSLATNFNDILFDAHENYNQHPNESERFVINKLENMLRGKIPDSAVPRLPEVAMALLKELANTNITQETILSYINRDPALASEVLRISNSALFRVGDSEEIANMERAITLLGLDNLKNIVSSALIKRLMLIAPIYFRMFGQHLWQHSLDCAQACKALAKFHGHADPNNAYLVGLMHDIGKLAIFSLLTQALGEHLDIEPRGSVFSYIVRDNSQSLSVRIARDWVLPDYIITALDEQIDTNSTTNTSTYGLILSQANMLAEFKSIAELAIKSNERFDALLEKHSIPLDLFKEAFPNEAEAFMNGVCST
jgi:HD-like signal output (HDOD) protein